MSLFDLRSKENLQEKLADMEKEVSSLKLKLEKENSDKEILQKQLSKGTDFDIGKLYELEKSKTKMQEYYTKMLFYERIVDRYREIIEQGETLSIPELKSKIDPDLDVIQQKLKNLPVNYDENPMRALELIKDYLDSITTVHNTNIDFWLDIEEVMKYNIADPMCKAVLLASFVSALELDYKILMCQMSNGEKKPLIIVELNEKSLLLDPNNKHSFFRYYDNVDFLLSKFEYKEITISKVLYEFNETEYITHEEDYD